MFQNKLMQGALSRVTRPTDSPVMTGGSGSPQSRIGWTPPTMNRGAPSYLADLLKQLGLYDQMLGQPVPGMAPGGMNTPPGMDWQMGTTMPPRSGPSDIDRGRLLDIINGGMSDPGIPSGPAFDGRSYTPRFMGDRMQTRMPLGMMPTNPVQPQAYAGIQDHSMSPEDADRIRRGLPVY